MDVKERKMHRQIRMLSQGRIARIGVVLIAGLSLYGCTGHYGRLQPSSAVTAIFKADRVMPGHKYYYTGPDGWPDAIIAVEEGFTLVSDMWTAFDPSPQRLRNLTDYAQTHYGMNARYFPYGYIILAPDGRKIGVWYSIWDWTTVEMRSEHEVVIYPPLTKDLWPDGDDDHDNDGDTP